jgi:hypothetical protein
MITPVAVGFPTSISAIRETVTATTALDFILEVLYEYDKRLLPYPTWWQLVRPRLLL